ncbi:MAG: tRNA pseudouridine(55) synthase TruB [Betaproteobacteria bacterium]
MDGVLLLDKPRGLSSNAALQHARRLLNAAKAGHTGTLDPMASGLLPLCFGEATKFAQALLDARKEYVAGIRFGTSTTTGDAEGEVLAEAPVTFDRGALQLALQRFIGASRQVPPRHAALKHQGRKYYEYARQGIEIPRPARDIVIDDLELVDFGASEAVILIRCSKGTYVRALAEDLAHSLGTVGHLAALRRTATGPFRIEQAITLDDLEGRDAGARLAPLLPIDAPLCAMSRIVIDGEAAHALVEGRSAASPAGAAGRLRAYGPLGRFMGIVEAAGGVLRPVRLVDTAARDDW